MHKKNYVEVLLSTYNGERYLPELLESLKAQSCPGIFLRVRDDGSSDGTKNILEQYRNANSWVTVSYENNIGVVRSFFQLLNSVDKHTKFAAFCDQDDVWDANKIERALNHLEDVPENIPALYFSALRLVDENLSEIDPSRNTNCTPSFLNALVQNVATGCTMVVNRPAIDLLSRQEMDFTCIDMHDSWIYLVLAAVGTLIYDPVPTMSYRQHNDNVIGSSSGIDLWLTRATRFKNRNKLRLVTRAKELFRLYGGVMPKENKQLCKQFMEEAGSSSINRRFRYALNSPVYRQKRLDDLLMRFLITLGWR